MLFSLFFCKHLIFRRLKATTRTHIIICFKFFFLFFLQISPPAGASLQLVPNLKFKIPQTLSEPSAKDERRMSEGSAKNKSLCGSHRAGAAEYVTKDKSLCGSHRAGTAEYVKPVRLAPKDN